MVIIDEISLRKGRNLMGKHLLKEKGTGARLLVRERDISESLCNFPWRRSHIRNPADFLEHSRKRVSGVGFIITASDVEVFGHHHKDRWRLLADIYDSGSVNAVSVREILEAYGSAEVETIPASWSTGKNDISEQIYYPLWHHPRNRLHKLLWQILDLAIEEVRSLGSETQNKKMDTLLSSCPFFWASCMPWWNGIIAENTADKTFALLSEIKDCPEKILIKAKELRKAVYSEVARLNTTGEAEKLQNEFLNANSIEREELHHLLN